MRTPRWRLSGHGDCAACTQNVAQFSKEERTTSSPREVPGARRDSAREVLSRGHSLRTTSLHQTGGGQITPLHSTHRPPPRAEGARPAPAVVCVVWSAADGGG
eukprot:gene17312-biopygen21866